MRYVRLVILSVAMLLPAELLCKSSSSSFSINDIASGGGNCALVEYQDGFSANPASLSGVKRSFFRETLDPSSGWDGNFLSQTLHLSPNSWLGLGGSVKIRENNVINAENLSYAWHLQTTILRFLSLGIAEDIYGNDADWRIGGIISIPTRFPISRIGIGWVSRGFDFSKVDIEDADTDMGRNVYAGAHIRLTVSKECYFNFTSDAQLIKDGRNIRLKQAPLRIGFEQVLSIGELRFSGRAALEKEEHTSPMRYSGGVSAGMGLIDLNAEAKISPAGTTWMAGATLWFGKTKPKKIEKISAIEPFVTESTIPWTFNVKADPEFDRIVILIEPPTGVNINFWHLTVLDSQSIKVVKSFENLGMPSSEFVIPYADLPQGKYQVDMTMLYDDGAKYLSRSETIQISGPDLISQGGGE